MRRLIIHADDFGVTRGVNRGILRAYREGVVSSTSLMANAGATEDAAALARNYGTLDIGCHVVLIDGAPVLPSREVPTLLGTPDSGGGRFRDGWMQLALAVLRRRVSANEIAAEVRAQILKLRGFGVDVSHVDTHKHVHLLSQLLRPILRAARECGVRAIRNPVAPVRPLALSHLLKRRHLWKRYSQVRVLGRLVRNFRCCVEDAGLVTTDGTFGIVVTGWLDERLFEAIVGSMPEGTWELVCHPGYCDDELASVNTRLRESRSKELAVLTSPAARQALEKNGIELISYREL